MKRTQSREATHASASGDRRHPGDEGANPRLDHVRRPQPPWRVADVTECGLPEDRHPTLSRVELAAKVRRLGVQRAAMTTCMTCLATAQRWPTFDDDPVEAIGRETHRGRDANPAFRDELLAIAALIERHPDEFAQLLAGIANTIRLSERRAARNSSARRPPR